LGRGARDGTGGWHQHGGQEDGELQLHSVAPSKVFDLQFDFVGDFTRPPTRVELEGDRDKKRKFILKCYQLNRLTGYVFCNEDQKKVQKVRGEFPRAK
jgi:hypothetical protein